jgi:hypothetical protein
MRSRISIAVLVVALASTLEAQTTWIVDGSNGPGTSFTDLPPAVAAAANGDTIIVRSGTYAPFHSTGKALTIRGDGASTTTLGTAGSSIDETTIDGVPAGMTFFMSGLRFAPAWPSTPPPVSVGPAGLRVVGPATVALADVVMLGTNAALAGYHGGRGLIMSNGAEVHLSRASVTGGTGNGASGGIGVESSSSSLSVDGSTITGGTGSGFGGTGIYGTGVATLSRSSVYGGSGFYGGSHAVFTGGGLIRVAGTSADVIKGGAGVLTQLVSIFAYPSASVLVHGNVTILPSSPGQPLTSGPVTTGAVALPYVSITGTATPAGELLAAQPVSATFDGVLPLAPFAAVVDLSPGFSTALSSVLVGELLVPFPTMIALEGVLDAAGQAQVTLTPAVSAPGLTNVPIYAQFGVYDAVLAKFRMSNGAISIFKN